MSRPTTDHNETTYRNGCRCDVCRTAMSRYANLRRLETLQGNPRHVDGTGTRRRIQALAALGWSRAELADQLNVSGPSINARLRKTGPVHRDTAAKVRALYDQLWDVTPPPMTGKAKGVRARIRRQAADAGWVVPMLWDAIDDPAAQPHVDDVRTARDRAPHRGYGVVNVDSLTDCADWGLTIAQAAQRLDVSKAAIDHGMSRLHPDTRDRLRARYARNLIAFEYGITS